MQMISSEAGTRMAKAKAALDAAELRVDCTLDDDDSKAYARCHRVFCGAARDLADELIASGYHDLDGGES